MYISVFSDGAAEEAGLMVGDYVLAVNGTDVTSIPHSEAADLARQGMLFSGLLMGDIRGTCTLVALMHKSTCRVNACFRESMLRSECVINFRKIRNT